MWRTSPRPSAWVRPIPATINPARPRLLPPTEQLRVLTVSIPTRKRSCNVQEVEGLDEGVLNGGRRGPLASGGHWSAGMAARAERELVLLKIRAPPGPTRTEVMQLIDIFRARVVDVSDRSLTIAVTGDAGKVGVRAPGGLSPLRRGHAGTADE